MSDDNNSAAVEPRLDCGHPLTPGRTTCLVCAAKAELAAFHRSHHYIAYLSPDGREIQMWMGDVLAHVHWTKGPVNGRYLDPQRFRPTNLSDRLTFVRAVDAHGGRWYGKGAGRGMSIRLHRSKAGRPPLPPPPPREAIDA